MKTNDFSAPQPRGQSELSDVSAEAMGQQPGKIHAPRFHRMSITSAENGYSVDHTTKHEPSDNDRNRETGDPMVGQGPNGSREITKTHLVTRDHPAYQHIHAIHESLSDGGSTRPHGQGFQTSPTHPGGPQNR